MEREQQDALQAIDTAVRAFCSDVEIVLRAALTAAGYHRHARGEWRKKRGGANMTDIQAAAQAEKAKRAAGKDMNDVEKELAVRQAHVPDTPEERMAVVQPFLSGGSKAQEVRAIATLRAHPNEFQIGWANPRDSLLELVAPSSPVAQEIIAQEYTFKLKEVAGINPTPLERLLAERIAVCRMQITHYERDYAARLKGGMSFQVSLHHQKRMDSLHRRYLSAIKSLAQVRRLQLPAVQVNIGGQQVNVAGEAINGAVRDLRAATENKPE